LHDVAEANHGLAEANRHRSNTVRALGKAKKGLATATSAAREGTIGPAAVVSDGAKPKSAFFANHTFTMN